MFTYLRETWDHLQKQFSEKYSLLDVAGAIIGRVGSIIMSVKSTW